MEKLTDLIAWILGALLAIVLFFVRKQSMTTDDKFKVMAEKLEKMDDVQDQANERLTKVEMKMEAISEHYIKVLDELKAKQDRTFDEVTEIKVLLAAIPKRKDD